MSRGFPLWTSILLFLGASLLSWSSPLDDSRPHLILLFSIRPIRPWQTLTDSLRSCFTLVCQIIFDSIRSRQILLISCPALSDLILTNDLDRSFLIFLVSFRSLLIPASIYSFLSKLSTSNLTYWKNLFAHSFLKDSPIFPYPLPFCWILGIVSLFISSKQIWEKGGGWFLSIAFQRWYWLPLYASLDSYLSVCQELFVAKSHWCGLFPMAPLWCHS